MNNTDELMVKLKSLRHFMLKDDAEVIKDAITTLREQQAKADVLRAAAKFWKEWENKKTQYIEKHKKDVAALQAKVEILDITCDAHIDEIEEGEREISALQAKIERLSFDEGLGILAENRRLQAKVDELGKTIAESIHADELQREITALQAKVDEKDEWTVLKCNELGDQIIKRNKTIKALQAKVDRNVDEILDEFAPDHREDMEKVKSLQTKIDKLEQAMLRIANGQYNDMAGNPAEWAQHIAMKAMGWRFEDGIAIPPTINGGND